MNIFSQYRFIHARYKDVCYMGCGHCTEKTILEIKEEKREFFQSPSTSQTCVRKICFHVHCVITGELTKYYIFNQILNTIFNLPMAVNFRGGISGIDFNWEILLEM